MPKVRAKLRAVLEAKRNAQQQEGNMVIKTEEDLDDSSQDVTIVTPTLDSVLQNMASQAVGSSNAQNFQSPMEMGQNMPKVDRRKQQLKPLPPRFQVLSPFVSQSRPLSVVRPIMLQRPNGRPSNTLAAALLGRDPMSEQQDHRNRIADFRDRDEDRDEDNEQHSSSNQRSNEQAVPFCGNCVYELPNLMEGVSRLESRIDQIISVVQACVEKVREEVPAISTPILPYRSPERAVVDEVEQQEEVRKPRKKYTPRPPMKRGKYQTKKTLERVIKRREGALSGSV